jgi:carbon-monoxide dehydrogenase medium subunit
MVQIKEYYRPDTLDEALALLQRPGAVPLMGTWQPSPAGTPQTVVDLQALGLVQLRAEEERLHLGAMLPVQHLVGLAEAGPFLAAAARREGPLTFRNAFTLGSVTLSRQPLSYLLIALLVLDAEVQIQRPGTSLRVELDRFLDDPDRWLERGLVAELSVLAPGASGGTAMQQVGRTPSDRPIVAVAVRIARQGDRCGTVRIALAGVADRPVRAHRAEESLAGHELDRSALEEAVALVESQLGPPSDFRGSREYRHHVAGVLTRRALVEAWGGASS